MLTVREQKHLLSLANKYTTTAFSAIRGIEILDDNDKEECMKVVEGGNFIAYRELDTLLRDELMGALKTAFQYIERDTLCQLSEIVVHEIERNNEVLKWITNAGAADCIETEKKKLMQLLFMLCDYADCFKDED